MKTAKELTNKMREDKYPVSLLHGKDMQPEERDRSASLETIEPCHSKLMFCRQSDG